jgi:hypothetical protein
MMRKIGTFAIAVLVAASFYAPASAQTMRGPNIDCNNPQNALTYYCNNRDQFGGAAPVVRGPVIIESEDMDIGATGSIMPRGPYMLDDDMMDDDSEIVIVR